jgi:hypothetical protein
MRPRPGSPRGAETEDNASRHAAWQTSENMVAAASRCVGVVCRVPLATLRLGAVVGAPRAVVNRAPVPAGAPRFDLARRRESRYGRGSQRSLR